MGQTVAKKRADKFGSEGRVEVGTRMVADPLEAGARYQASVNVRESSIDHMHSRGRIDQAQKEAGDRFRRLWERAAVGRNQAMDTTKEPVDGGGIGDPISDSLIKSSIELARVMQRLGPIGCQLLISLVGEGRTVAEVASKWSRSGGAVRGERAEGYITGRMIEALDDLVRLWKLEGSPIEQNRPKSYLRNGRQISVSDDIRSSSDGHSGPVTELSVGRFGDVVENSQRPIDNTGLMTHHSGNIK